LGKEGGAPLDVVGPTGPLGPWAIVPTHGPDFVLGWVGTGLKLHSTVHRRARAGLGPNSSCWARARVGPEFRALG
jgi:hypothetical protein